jgi:hypothetical protein
LAGHSGTAAEEVYRKKIRPVLPTEAVAVDSICKAGPER